MSNLQSANAAVHLQHLAVLRAAELEFRLLTAAPPAAPEGLELLLSRAGEGWGRLPVDVDLATAIRALRKALYFVPGREDRSQTIWQEALATSLFAARIASATEASVAAPCAAGLLHRAGEALAMQAIDRAEQLVGVALDRGTRSGLVLSAERDLTAALLTAWRLPEPVAAIVRDWRDYGAAGKYASGSLPVYFGHALAVEALHPEFRSPGLMEALAAATGLDRDRVRALRTQGVRLRELLLALS